MARLYFRGADANQLGLTFAREGRLTGKRSLRHMRRVSKIVMETSRSYAPVDWKGYTSKDPPGEELEKSHRVEEQYNGARIEATVVVGGEVNGVDVDLYAGFMHDGYYKLGKRSAAKMAASGKLVGREFLARALEENEEQFDALLDELMEGLMR